MASESTCDDSLARREVAVGTPESRNRLWWLASSEGRDVLRSGAEAHVPV
jgi:hypothetical protein